MNDQRIPLERIYDMDETWLVTKACYPLAYEREDGTTWELQPIPHEEALVLIESSGEQPIYYYKYLTSLFSLTKTMQSMLTLTDYTVAEGDTVIVKRTGEFGIITWIFTPQGSITFTMMENPEETRTMHYTDLLQWCEDNQHPLEIFRVGYTVINVTDAPLTEEIQRAIALNGGKVNPPSTLRFVNRSERTATMIWTGQVVDECRFTYSDVSYHSMSPEEQERYKAMTNPRITQYNLAIAHERLYHVQNTNDGWDSFVVLKWANL